MMFAFANDVGCADDVHFVNDVASLKVLWQTSQHCELHEQHHYAEHNIMSPLAMHHSDNQVFSGGNLMLGKTVKVIIDRPMGTYHPKHKDLYYPINYGYIEGIIAPDGEEQDAYILGVDEAVSEFTGKIIAIIKRFDDVEEKWVVAPEDMAFTKEEIMKQVEFQEKHFKTEIIM